MNIDFVFKIAAIGIIAAVLNQLLIRSGREEQAMMTTLAGLIVVLMMIISRSAPCSTPSRTCLHCDLPWTFFKILGFCLCALVLLSVLRQYNPGYAVLAALACCMVLLWFVMQALGPVLSFVETLFAVFRLRAFGNRVQGRRHRADGPKRAGPVHGSRANGPCRTRVELAGKVAVLLAAMPLFTVLTDTLLALLR